MGRNAETKFLVIQVVEPSPLMRYAVTERDGQVSIAIKNIAVAILYRAGAFGRPLGMPCS